MNYENSFGNVAGSYQTFRPKYPSELFLEIISCVNRPYRRAVDLGAGTGLSTLPLCNWFDEIIAVEPDERMAKSIPALSPKIRLITSLAETVAIENGSTDLITMGNSFYWTDGKMVLEKAIGWLRDNGICAIYRYGFPKTVPAIKEILDLELQMNWNQFRHPRLLDEDYSKKMAESSGPFRMVIKKEISNIIPLDAKRIVGFLRSTSYVSKYLDSRENHEDYLDALEKKISNKISGLTEVDFSVELIVLFKPES